MKRVRTPRARGDEAAGGEFAPATGTRGRILAAARELISARGDAAISLVEVAAAAGVSRQTMYLLFGSRAGLLLAMVDEVDRVSPAPGRLAALRQALPAPEAFEPYLRAWFDYLPVVYPVARALSAAATAGDADAAAAWDSRMARLRGGFLQITRGVHAAGRLRTGWTPETAADWIYTMTHVDLWHHLVEQSGWKPAKVVERVVAALREALLVAAR